MRTSHGLLVIIAAVWIGVALGVGISPSAQKELQGVTFLTQVLGKAKASYTTDDILELLNNLKKSAKATQESLDRSWSISERALKRNIAKLFDAMNGQAVKCKKFAERANRLNESITEMEDIIINNDNRIKSIQEHLNILRDRRCQMNELFVDNLKNIRETITALQMLRKMVSGEEGGNIPEARSLSLVQLALPYKKILDQDELSFLDSLERNYAKQAPENSTEGTAAPTGEPAANAGAGENPANTQPAGESEEGQKRTAEEVGTGHIDNNKGPLEVKSESFDVPTGDELKDKILELISSLIQKLQKMAASLQEHEITSADYYVKYRISLEREIVDLLAEIKAADQFVERNWAIAEVMAAEVEDCQGVLAEFQSSIDQAQNTYNTEKETYDRKVARTREEMNIVDDVLRLYENQVVKKKDKFENRAEDYIANKNFDETSGDTRVEKIANRAGL